jgi:hypothetical protein
MARLVAMVVLAVVAPVFGQRDYDQWYVLDWSGQRAGWMHLAQMTDDDLITTVSETRLSMKRGAAVIDISMESKWVETVEGRPVSMRSVQKLGAIPVTQTFTFAEDSIEANTIQGANTSTRTIPLPEGNWKAPAAASREFKRQLDEGVDPISQTILEQGLVGLEVMTSTYEGIEQTTIEVLGKVVPAYKAKVTSDVMGGISSQSYFNAHGLPLRDEIDFGFATITTIAADKQLALSELNAPEIMASTFVSPTGSFAKGANPRHIRRASYILSIGDGDMPELPTTGAQRVEPLEDGRARVIVDLDHLVPAGDIDRDEFLAPSTLVDASDGRIISITQEATRDAGDDPAARAEAIRRFVYDYVEEKNLGVGVATASEVCATREGDCSEHAVLLAAMLRADAIPSRTASGLVYVDSFLDHERIFGYHMWAQALLDVDGEPTWVDLDGTFPRQVSTDATHIALGVSSMSDADSFDGMVALVPLMGRLQIEIEN